MNICLRLIWLLPTLALAVLSAGCATGRPEVNTWHDARFSPTPTNTIALTERPHPNAQDQALGQMLVTEMQREGFHFVSAAQADYLLTYVLDDTAEEREVVEPRPPDNMLLGRSLTPQTTDQIFFRSYQPGFQSGVTSTVVFQSKDIRLYVYTNPKTHREGLQMVWQGSISAGTSVTVEKELRLVRTLLTYFGRNQNGKVGLVE